MKKIIVVALIIGGIFIYGNKAEEVIIPKEAIRFRVIANSDNETDQNIKMIVRDNLEKEVVSDLTETNNLNQARSTIYSNLDKYNMLVKKTLNENNNSINSNDFSINYGLNYFPEKTYKGVKYESGNYESLVVTLGNGNGKNWWCVLFPPLCLLESEETEAKEEVEYKFFIKELIDKYLK